MGFFSGRATFLRYRVDAAAPGLFGPEHLAKLANHAFGKQPPSDKDGAQLGWIAGEDILDLGFDLAKNVINDTLHFALRCDTKKLPGDLLRAYTRAEVQTLAAANPSGRPTAQQKKEARETAQARLEAEGQDGRFIRRKAFPVLWDGLANHLLLGTTSPSALDHGERIFKETFDTGLTHLDAGTLALARNEMHKFSTEVLNLKPAPFVPGNGTNDVAWVSDAARPSYLGNEFLLWLWFVLETEGDMVTLADDSVVTVMIARTLLLECPRAHSGSETIRTEAPTKLPEARRAIQAGKLPRQAGLILVRHDQQYELTLHAETLAMNGVKFPQVEERDERGKLDDRAGQLRHLIDTVDLLYDAFLTRRLGRDWLGDLERMQRWLVREDRIRLAETA